MKYDRNSRAKLMLVRMSDLKKTGRILKSHSKDFIWPMTREDHVRFGGSLIEKATSWTEPP